MTKPRRIVIVLLLLAGLSAPVLWRRMARPSEPVFEGRTLSSWLNHHVASSAADPPYGSPGWKKANEVLRSVGTNGIPVLLAMIRAKEPSPILRKISKIAERFRLLRINDRPASDLHQEAQYAFEVLGTNAASAVPELIGIYDQNISPSSQMYTAKALGNIGKYAEAALPVLITRFSHTNREVRYYAVSAVATISGEPALVLPALTTALQDSYVSTRWNALSGLSRFHSKARAVVPEIEKMLNDPGMVGDSSITQQVVVTLWRIAPEKAGIPLVVESSTPMIVQGKTTEALKMVYQGKPQTLIPAGTPVPAIRQYWYSDPRPQMTLYRGASAPEGTDQLLGHFEVLDVPPGDVNISTLCIVTDGQILLNARDNNREKQLEIRRVERHGEE